MVTLYYNSTGTLTATVTDEAGAGVTGATVTLTLSLARTALPGVTWPVTMTDAGAGAYTYTVPATLLSPNRTYAGAITAAKDGIQRYAEVPVRCVVDTD